MEHKGGLKLRISRMFQVSFASCRTRHISDDVLAPQPQPTHRHQEQPLPFPSICNPTMTHNCIRRRPKVCGHSDFYSVAGKNRSNIKREAFPSSDDERDTLFSSRTLSSDSAGMVKDSFAVVKRSIDPYSDFRRSMVEMIVAKQIFGAADQEQLLHCFLSLNSRHHHNIIVRVFTDITDCNPTSLS